MELGKEVDADFLAGMHRFREWAVMVASEAHNPDWIMPEPGGKIQEFAFSLEAYNHFTSHSDLDLPPAKSADELHEKLKRHAKYLYSGESAIRLRHSGFFMLPDKIVAINFKRNK